MIDSNHNHIRLIIACGNSLRQDDGAGLILARWLAHAWRMAGHAVHHIEVQQLLPELALEVAAAPVKEVWFVDTRDATGEHDPTFNLYELAPCPSSPALGHHLSAESVLLYAHELFWRRPPSDRPRVWHLTVPGFAFGHGERLSGRCATALDDTFEEMMLKEEETAELLVAV